MSIPLSALGISKDYIEKHGVGAMLISTFGASGTGSLPMDMTFLDNAQTPYSADESTSGEKEDTDLVSVPLAKIGNLKGGEIVITSKKIEENSVDISYTGTWKKLLGTSCSDGKMVESNEIGAKAVYKFNGTGIKLFAQTGDDKGIAKVTIDGKVYPADMYRNLGKDNSLVFEKTDLTEGEHTITVECSGLKSRKSKGTTISIDAFEVINK